MLYFPINSFRPIESKEDSTDQDRTVLRICEGLAPVPVGALSSGPRWLKLWGIASLKDSANSLLSGRDASKAHVLKLENFGTVFLIVWSMVHQRALGLFCVAEDQSARDFDSSSTYSLTAPSGSVWINKDPTALWYASKIADRWIIGNGTDANLEWGSGSLSELGPSSVPTDQYDRSRYSIPPCTSFRLNATRSLFASGNSTHPLRVWVTDAPQSNGDAINFGVYSLDSSYIDLKITDASRIVALSGYQQYITAHTDKSPVNLFGVDRTADGWKCDQAPSAANASSINPACLADTAGDMSYYIGGDLEIYQDQAVRSGPYEKRGSRDQEIVTAKGAGLWNRTLRRPLLSWGYHSIFDRKNRLLWLWARLDSEVDGRPALFVFNERSGTVSGPWRYPAASVSTQITSIDLKPIVADPVTGPGIGDATLGTDFLVS